MSGTGLGIDLVQDRDKWRPLWTW